MGFFDFGFGAFGVLFFLMFILVFGFIGFVLAKSIRQWNKDSRSPVLTVEATVVAKRTNYHRGTGNSMGHSTYYATFQVESGDRMELAVPSMEYGYLVEGDRGKVTFQGSRFQKFERTR